MRKTDDWLVLFRKEGVPSGPINDIEQMFADPQVQHRAVAIDIDGMPLVANPIKYSRSNMTYDKPPPTLGEDTQVVLSEYLGLGWMKDIGLLRKLRHRGLARIKPMYVLAAIGYNITRFCNIEAFWEGEIA